MPHLPAERLAALADDTPPFAPSSFAPSSFAPPPRDVVRGVAPTIDPITTEEAEHLAACPECARERDAYRALLAVATDERARLAPPLTSWGAIAAQLREEGCLADAGTGAARDDESASPALAFALAGSPSFGRRRASAAGRWGRRAAAAAMFVAGGVVAGRVSAGLPPLGLTSAASAAARDSVRVAMAVASGTAPGAAAAAATAGVSLVADTMVAFRSTTEALVALSKAERDYQVAAAYLLAHDSSAGASRLAPGGDSTGIYRARLAALDNVMAATREALYEAPHDPVINRYYLATVGAREATLQQLNTALPMGARLTRF